MPRTIESELALVASGERWQGGAKINNSITGYPAALRALAAMYELLLPIGNPTICEMACIDRIRCFLAELNA